VSFFFSSSIGTVIAPGSWHPTDVVENLSQPSKEHPFVMKPLLFSVLAN
jgi:hypothetical protein